MQKHRRVLLEDAEGQETEGVLQLPVVAGTAAHTTIVNKDNQLQVPEKKLSDKEGLFSIDEMLSNQLTISG